MSNPNNTPLSTINSPMTLTEALDYEKVHGKKNWVNSKTKKPVIIGNTSYN